MFFGTQLVFVGYPKFRLPASNPILTAQNNCTFRAWVESSEGRRKCGVYLIKTIKKSSESQSPDDTGPKSKVGTLPDTLMAEAKKNDWTVISMKNDWKRIFAW